MLIKLGDEWVDPTEIINMYVDDSDETDEYGYQYQSEPCVMVHFRHHTSEDGNGYIIHGLKPSDLDYAAAKINEALLIRKV